MEPFPESICHRCEHLQRVEGARSAFLMCKKLPVKYPPQPVRQCVAFSEGKPPPQPSE